MSIKLVLLCLALLVIPPLVYTQSTPLVLKTNNLCIPSDEMQQSLEDKFNEVPFVIGQGNVESSNIPEIYTGIMIVYANPKTTTFTIVMHFEGKNVSCVMMAGEGFQAAPTADPTKRSLPSNRYDI